MSGPFVQHVPYIGMSLLVLVLSFWLARQCSQVVEAGWGRTASHQPTAKFLGRFTYAAMLVVGVGVALRISGIDATLFLGAATFAAGFALRSWLENLISGLIVVSTKAFGVKSFVGVEGDMGTVMEIGPMSTIAKRITNQAVRIPNSHLTRHAVTVYGVYPQRFLKFDTWTGLDADPAAAIAVLDRMLAEEPLVLREPEPMVLFTDMSDEWQTFEVRFWIGKKAVPKFWIFKAEMKRRATEALEAAGFEAPYPMRTLHVNRHDSDLLAPR